MYNMIICFSIFWVRIFFKIVNKYKSLINKVPLKQDTKKLTYSYFLHEIGEFDIEANLLKNKVLQLKKGEVIYNFWNAYTDLDGEASLKIAGDKVLCTSMLSKAGLPVPECVELKSGDFISALKFKRKINEPIVVKPAKNTGDSRGVTIKPEDFFSIWFAVNKAGLYGEKIIVEKFYDGTNYRLLFCKGTFLGACSRIPAQVYGNGSSTIKELIDKMNLSRLEQGELQEYNPDTRPILYKVEITKSLKKCIKRKSYTLDSVPRKGSVVNLQEICHWLKGGQYIDVTDIISEEIKELCRKAANILGIKLAGVDVIAEDIENPQKGTYLINEVNTSPHILVQYEIQNRDKFRPVAKEIIKMMFDI